MDPHVNFSEATGRQSDGLIAYRENPLTDAGEAADLAVDTLDGLMQTEDLPATVWDRPPIVWPPGGTASDEDPMLSLQARAREIEAEMPDLVAVNVHAGFPYADVPEAGVAFSAVTTGDLELARGAVRELSVMAASLREDGTPDLVTLGETMERLKDHREGPVLLVEPSDDVERGLTTRRIGGMAQPGEPLFGINTTNGGRIVIFAGGIPLMRDGEVVGAIGVSGGTVDEDHEVAEAGVAAFG